MFKKSQSAPPFFYIFRHYATYRKLQKKLKKNSEIFFSIFSFLRAFVVSSCRKSGFRFRVFLSLRYGADLSRYVLVSIYGDYFSYVSINALILLCFCIQFVFSGSVDGNILMYDLNKLSEEQGVPVQGAGAAGVIPAHGDCCNSVSCMPPNQNVGQSRHDVIYLASGSGQRRCFYHSFH